MSDSPVACAVDGGGCPGCVVVKGLATLCRIALGALFVFSGAVKLSDPQAFAFAIKGFKLVENHDLISQATFSIPWTEVLIGALLVIGLRTRAASGLLLLMLAGFTAAIVSVLARDIDTSCGCFGKFLGSEIDQTTIIRNVVLLSMAMVVFVKRGGFLTLDGRRSGPARADQGAP
jgi:uncharacterized membrane protein YphA (DoxX/SURF4 family)